MVNTNQNLISLATVTPDTTIAQIISADPKSGYLLGSIDVQVSGDGMRNRYGSGLERTAFPALDNLLSKRSDVYNLFTQN
ncbi:MAG TPA: hypothetical protein VKA08_08600 [Balneolales bacterium]|nr:hypothetical protein [Balneolales bacterium]